MSPRTLEERVSSLEATVEGLIAVTGGQKKDWRSTIGTVEGTL